jgi:hypothetical protein
MSPLSELRPIPGWEDRYSASADGRIWSHRHGPLSAKWSHPKDPGRSHLRVQLYRGDGSRQWRYVHMLVAAAWLGPRPDGEETCHIDGDRLNNAADNLYYATRSQNALDRERHRRERELADADHLTYAPDAALGF